MDYLAENTFLTKENYEERLKEINSWFDKEDKSGDYDELSNIEELKLLCEAKDAYIRYLEAPVISSDTHHVWTEFVSDELKDKLFKLKSDNGMVPLGTFDEIVQLFVNDIEKLGNALEKEREKLKSNSTVEFTTNVKC